MDLFLGHEITLIPCRENWQALHVPQSVKQDRRHWEVSVKPAACPHPCTPARDPPKGQGRGGGHSMGAETSTSKGLQRGHGKSPTFQ